MYVDMYCTPQVLLTFEPLPRLRCVYTMTLEPYTCA